MLPSEVGGPVVFAVFIGTCTGDAAEDDDGNDDAEGEDDGNDGDDDGDDDGDGEAGNDDDGETGRSSSFGVGTTSSSVGTLDDAGSE